MKLKGVEGMTIAQLQDEINNGGKFVIYSYCFSIIVMSFKRSSDIYFLKAGQSSFIKGLPWTAISFVFGWWGLPWGIIYTIGSLITNFGGGKNVTTEVLKTIQQSANGHVFEFETAEKFVK